LPGLIIAFVGVSAAHLFEMPELDGVASIRIGPVLAATATFLVSESKGLLLAFRSGIRHVLMTAGCVTRVVAMCILRGPRATSHTVAAREPRVARETW
jgi:hypothetical protein